jgi:proline iminopeptidase
MVEKILANTGNITVGKFELKYQIEGRGASILGHSGHMSPDSSPQSFEAGDRYFQESVCPERKALLAKNLANLLAEIDINPSQTFITRALKFGPMVWYNENFDASDLWKDVKDLTIRVFEKSGHTPQYEEPELFDQELLQWLNSHIQ